MNKAIELYFSDDKNKRTLDVLTALLNGESPTVIAKQYGIARQHVYVIQDKYIKENQQDYTMKKVKNIKAVGTGKQNMGVEFYAKPDGNGDYKLFPSGSNLIADCVRVKSIDEALVLMQKGYNIFVTDGSTTAQRTLKSCEIEYITD